MFKITQQVQKLGLSTCRQGLTSGIRYGNISSCREFTVGNSATLVNRNHVLTRLPAGNWSGSCTLNTAPLVSQHTLLGCSVPKRAMSTLEQMHRKGPPKKTRFNKQKTTLEGCPQKKGIVLKVIIKKPKKPNSANRKCIRVKLTSDKHIIAYIPGEGHNLQEHNIVLIEGGRKQDLPGVKHTVVRGKYDCSHVVKKT